MKEQHIKILIIAAGLVSIYIAYKQFQESKKLNEHIRTTVKCNCNK